MSSDPNERPALVQPTALLLDFGGVLVDGPVRESWHHEVAARFVTHVRASVGDTVLYGRVVSALQRAEQDAASDVMRHDGNKPWSAAFWRHYLGGLLPGTGSPPDFALLSRWVSEAKYSESWVPRPGIGELLLTAQGMRLPMAIVSNAVCGQTHRDVVADAGWAHFFEAELYSDEVGVRKPDPSIVLMGAAALGAHPRGCWFIGDSREKDLPAATGAGCGAAVLMKSSRLEVRCDARPEADAYVEGAAQLRDLLVRSVEVIG